MNKPLLRGWPAGPASSLSSLDNFGARPRAATFLERARPFLIPFVRPGCLQCCLRMSKERFPIFPTRMALQTMKLRLRGAVKGHSLLKKKSDALTMKFRALLTKIRDAKEIMGTLDLTLQVLKSRKPPSPLLVPDMPPAISGISTTSSYTLVKQSWKV